MKLIYLHQYFIFPDTPGGTRSYDLSKKFVEQGIDVTVITSSATLKNMSFTKRWTNFEREGIKFWVLRNAYSHKMSFPRRIISFLHFVIFSSFKLLFLKGDFVLATSTPLTIAIPAMLKKWITKTPYIFEVRDVWPEGPIQEGIITNKFIIYLLRKFEKSIYNNASYVVPLSVGMKRDILSRVEVENMEVIPNISEINRFQNVDFSSKVDLGFDLNNKKIILYAGRLGRANEIIYVARLAEKMFEINPTVIFVIIGDGSEKGKVINYCKVKGILNKNIFFPDPVSKNTLPQLYNMASMGSSFVWNKKIMWDNSANKFFDSLAAARPILINYQGWQADLIKGKKCGFILPYNFTKEDVVGFSNYLMDEKGLLEESKNAFDAAKDFTLEKAIERYLNIFEFLTLTQK